MQSDARQTYITGLKNFWTITKNWRVEWPSYSTSNKTSRIRCRSLRYEAQVINWKNETRKYIGIAQLVKRMVLRSSTKNWNSLILKEKSWVIIESGDICLKSSCWCRKITSSWRNKGIKIVNIVNSNGT